MTIPVLLFLLVAALGLVLGRHLFLSFRAQRLSDYAGQAEPLDPRRHLAGPLRCDGVLYGPFGRVASRFTAQMQGDWSGDEGRLSEVFTYDSGRTQQREWQLRLEGGGELTARASDVIGPGRGAYAGPGLRMRYRLRLPAEAGGHVLDVIDWMYLAPGGALVNRSQFTKFGIPVAELIATIRPEGTRP